MTNNLLQLKRDLKSFAKKCKGFKYTDSALFTFLLNGMLISVGELNAESKDSGISNQMNLINSSIGQMRKDFKHARAENDKLIKNTNLELTQLMEQGDHVTKSPWSNWQIGANNFYNDWHGHFKGRGNRVQEGKFYQRDTTMEKYNYQLKNLSTYGATRLKLDSNNMENPVEIQIDASLRTLAIDKPAPTFVPTTPSGGLPPFEPLMVTPPIINPKNVNISQPPQSPTINVGVEDVPDNYTGYNKDGTMANNSLLSQLDLTGGNFNLFFHGGGQPYDYSFINASENATYIPSGSGINLPSSDNGTSPKVAFFGMGGKLLAEIPSNVTVNAVSNVSGDVNVLYYMGNNNDASNPESKLIHRGTTNLYGNDLLVVKIDNVTSNGNITFVNEGKINGYAQKGTYTDLITGIPGGTGNDPKGHIFAAFTYGDAGVDTVENGNNGVVEFYAPKSYGWVYTSATNAPLKRSSINNGIMRLFGSESIGVSGTTNNAGTTNNDRVVQTSWADIQLNKPIEIYGDKSVGVSFLVESDNTVSSNFSNSKFNVQIGGSALTAQDATYGDTEEDVSKR